MDKHLRIAAALSILPANQAYLDGKLYCVRPDGKCPATRGGLPRYSALAITTALTLRAVFRLALRQTEGLITCLLRLLGLDLAAPDHSTISRRGEALPVSRPRPGREPLHLLVDSTGLKGFVKFTFYAPVTVAS
jgi:hypothetical protein